VSTDKKNKDKELLIDGVEPERNEDNRSGKEEEEDFGETQELNAVVNMIKASLSEECPNLPDKCSLLKEVFEKADDKILVKTSDEETQTTLQETLRADSNNAVALGDACDRIIAGHTVIPSVDEADENLIQICRMIHSSFAEPRLGEIKKRAILKDVFSHRKQIKAAHEKPQGSQKPSAGKRTLFASLDTRARLLGAAALAAGLAALVFTWSLRRFDEPSLHKGSPINRTKRSQQRIARMIPRPFPAEQTFTHRMELLYKERLQANREDLINRSCDFIVVRLSEQYSVCAAEIGRSPK
jgi:hypothetical protein